MDPTHAQPATDIVTSLGPLVTGPAAAVVVSIVALWKLWGRIEKMMDSMQTLVVDNTKAMQAMQNSSEAQVKSLEVLSLKVDNLLNGLHREVSQPGIAVRSGP